MKLFVKIYLDDKEAISPNTSVDGIKLKLSQHEEAYIRLSFALVIRSSFFSASEILNRYISILPYSILFVIIIIIPQYNLVTGNAIHSNIWCF